MAITANRKIQFSISCNAQQPKKEIDALNQVLEDLLARRRQMIAAGQNEGKDWDQLKTEIRNAKKELRDAEANFETLQKVIADLSNASMPQLKKAFKEGQKAIGQMSEGNENLKPMQAALQEIQRQMDVISGKAKNVAQGVGDIENRTDGWLASARRDIQNYIASLDDIDEHYKEQLKLLGKIEAEEKRRADARRASEEQRAKRDLKLQAREAERRANTGDYAGLSQNEIEAGKKAMVDYQKTLEFGSERWKQYGEAIGRAEEKLNSFKQKQEGMTLDQAKAIITDKDATTSQLREARSTLVAGRDKVPTSDTAKIKEFDKALQMIDDRLDAVNGKVKKTEISWLKMREVMADPKGAIGEDIKKTMDAIQERIKKLPAGSKAVVNLRAEYAKLEKVLKGVEGELVDVDDVIKRSRKGEATIDELKKAYKQLEEEINHINTAEDEFIEKQKQLKGLKAKIDDVTNATNKHGGAWSTALHNLTAYVGMFSAFNLIKTKITDSIRDNYAYSDSLANIRKVSGLTSESINKLSTDLAKIDTRTSQEEMASIAYTGAKLGLGKYGVEGLTQFTQAANQVNVALKEDMGEDALKNLSKMVEVMGLIPKMGVEKSMLATSSALFKLASTSTASADQVVEFAKRLTGMSRTAGITTDQLLALGSASDSMMLMPEVASTAFSKLIAQLQRAPGAIEESLQIPKGTIDDLFSAGKSMDAIVMILEKMKAKGNMNALDDVFKDLGSDGARLISVMVTMSKNVNMLKSHLYEANEAFEKATAVTDEYNIQQETAQAYLERANNLWQEAFVNPTGVDMVKALGKAWYDTSAAMTDAVSMIWLVKGAIGAMTGVTWLFIKMLPTLVAVLVSGGVLHAFASLKSEVGLFAKAVKIAREEWKLLSTVMNTPVGWISAGFAVAALVLNLYDFMKANDQAIASQKKINEYFAQGAANADEETRKLNEYIRALDGANVSQQTREKLIAKFNNEYGSYLEKLGIEVNNVNDLRDAYSRLNDEIRKKAFAQMRDQAMNDILTPLRTETHKKGFDIDQKLEKLGTGDIERTWLDSEYEKWKNGGLVGVNAYDPNSMGNYLYRQVMQNMYGANYNRLSGEAGRVNIGTAEKPKWVDELKDVNFADLKADIIEYVNDRIKETNAENAVNKEFDKELHGWQEFEVEVYGHLHDKPGKGKGGSGGGSPEKKEEQIAKDRANALIANIKAFYEEQERMYLEWVTKMNEKEEVVTKEAQASRIAEFETYKKEALGKARQSIATLNGEWEKYLKDDLPKHMFQDDAVSKQLIEAMNKSDIKGLHDLFAKLSGDLSRENNRTLAENLGALLDQIFANGSKELREAAEKLLERQRELYAILNRDKFVDNVNQQTRGNLDKWGFLTPAEGIDEKTQQGQQQMAQGFRELISKTRSQVHDLYEMVLIKDEDEFKEKMQSFLASATKSFNFANIEGNELHALLLMLIDDERNYEKALKDTDAQMKQRNDEAWLKDPRNKKHTEDILGLENALSFQKLYGKPKSNIKGNDKDTDKETLQTSWRGVGEGMGFEFKIDNDPEILLIKARMKAERDAFLEKQRLHELGNASDEEYNEKLKSYLSSLSAYSDRVLQDISSQTDALMSFMSPIMTFGEAMGDAFATMREDSEQGKKAVQQAVKQMIKSFATQSLQLIMKNEQEQANMASHYAVMQAMRQAFNQAELQEENTNSTALLAAKQVNDTKELNMDALKEQKKAALKSAGIFGWCVSELGPIAGPIAYSAMMATLMGLLNYALSFIGGGDNKADNGAKSVNTKLVSGMLTYDKGNVQTVIGDDGKVYEAVDGEIPAKGVNLLTEPTIANVNGQRAIIAEQGPEFVIGRETSKALMMRPDLLSKLQTLDAAHSGRSVRTFDRGNVGEVASAAPAPVESASVSSTTADAETRQMIAATMSLLQRLEDRLSQPIQAKVNMWGDDGLWNSNKKAQRFMRGKE